MVFKDFFEFSGNFESSTFEPSPSTFRFEPSDLVIAWMDLIKGRYEGVIFPIIFEQAAIKKLSDILNTGIPGFYLISDKMKNVLEENHLTGWKVFPVKLYDKKGNEITGYHGFSVLGQSGATSYKKSEIIEKRLIPSGPLGKYFRGVSFDKWDGSDFFTPDGTYQTLITRKAADALKKNKITNLYLENLAELEVHVRDVQKSERLDFE